MSESVVRKEPFAIGSPRAAAAAWGLTIVTAVIVTQFKDGAAVQQYMYGLVTRRGPTTFLILVAAYNVAITLIMAYRWKARLSAACLLSYPLASLLPILLGILGTLHGLAQVVTSLADPELERARLAVSLGVAFDPLLLGTFVSIGLLYFSLLLMRRNRTSNNAIEPYS